MVESSEETFVQDGVTYTIRNWPYSKLVNILTHSYNHDRAEIEVFSVWLPWNIAFDFATFIEECAQGSHDH